jgi:hypothetical protein
MASVNRRTYFPVSFTNSLITCIHREKKYLERGKEADHYGVLAVGGKRVRANSNKNWSFLVNLFHAGGQAA